LALPTDERAVLLSLQPRFANAITGGKKDVELRRGGAALDANRLVLLYASSPQKAIVGTARAASLTIEEPEAIWSALGHRTLLSKSEFDKYFEGSGVAFAVELESVRAWRRTVPLALLRSELGVEPSQSYRYVTQDQATWLQNYGESQIVGTRGVEPTRRATERRDLPTPLRTATRSKSRRSAVGAVTGS
jgi:predicted transcriptional regulator